jgi:hypothetical protein
MFYTVSLISMCSIQHTSTNNINVPTSILLHLSVCLSVCSAVDVTTSTSEFCPGLGQSYWVVWGSGPEDGNGYQTEIMCPVSKRFQ